MVSILCFQLYASSIVDEEQGTVSTGLSTEAIASIVVVSAFVGKLRITEQVFRVKKLVGRQGAPESRTTC